MEYGSLPPAEGREDERAQGHGWRGHLPSSRSLLVAVALGVVTLCGVTAISRVQYTPPQPAVVASKQVKLQKVCPKYVQAFKKCRSNCVQDGDCSDGQMCCDNGCGKQCKWPVLRDLTKGCGTLTVPNAVLDNLCASAATGPNDFYSYGTQCHATCSPGYKPSGIGEFTCLESKGWATVKPFKCVPKSCPNFHQHLKTLLRPDADVNGVFVACKGDGYKDACVASCGNKWTYRYVCSESGRWVGGLGFKLDCAGKMKPGQKPKPKVCCQAMTADCLACKAGMTAGEYCKVKPKTEGCAKVAKK